MPRTRRQQIEGTRLEVEAIIAEEDAEQGYPRKGVPVGKGPHTAQPDTWDGTGATPPGWTKTWAKPNRHPARLSFSVPIRDVAHRRRIRGKRFAGRTIREADFKDRDSTWDPTDDA